MELLKLGLVGLPAAEESLVATLFRLHKVEPSFIWTLSSLPPFDALLVDAACEDALFLPLKGAGTRVTRLGPANSGPEVGLQRPIRSDLLIKWLNAVEVEILHGGQDQFSSTLSASSAAHKDEVHAAVLGTGATVTQPEHSAVLREFVRGASAFKLLRWPSQALLKGDVARIRMATFLSRRPLRFGELVSLSRVPEPKCEAYVEELLSSNLLERLETSAKSAARGKVVASGSSSQSEAEPPKARGVGASLIATIRKRFGIW